MKKENLPQSNELQQQAGHISVLLNEILTHFKEHKGNSTYYWDGTFGRGGHTRAILENFPQIKVIAMDCDHQAIEYAQQNFKDEIQANRLEIFHHNYFDFLECKKKYNWPQFDLMLLDLGVSSPQLDQADRGFSFYHDGPLDMRMDQRRNVTAEEIVNDWDEDDLYTIFRELGEIQKPNRVIRAILNDRKTKRFTRTQELAGLIERVDGWRKKGVHPATQYFMGLRLAVNQELVGLRENLNHLIEALAPAGLLAVISFHSLEDRIVKNIFKDHLNFGTLVNKKVIIATEDEIKMNSRSRSAKLRIFERTP